MAIFSRSQTNVCRVVSGGIVGLGHAQRETCSIMSILTGLYIEMTCRREKALNTCS